MASELDNSLPFCREFYQTRLHSMSLKNWCLSFARELFPRKMMQKNQSDFLIEHQIMIYFKLKKIRIVHVS